MAFPPESALFSLLDKPLVQGLSMVASYASQMGFANFIAEETSALKKTFSAFAARLDLDPQNFQKTFAKTAEYSSFMISRKPVIMNISQQSEIKPAEGTGDFSLEGFKGGFFGFTMGPAFAKHGFGFLRVEADGKGYIFPTLTLPDAIPDLVSRYDVEDKFLPAIVQAFSLVDHDWAHQLTPRTISDEITGRLTRPAPINDRDLSRQGFSAHFNACVNMEEDVYFRSNYEAWAGSAHALAIHKLWDDGGREQICFVIDDYLLQLKDMRGSIQKDNSEAAANFYRYGFDFLAFNFTRAFSKSSPLVEYIFAQSVDAQEIKDQLDHTAIQLFLSYNEIKVQQEALNIPLHLLGRANYERLADSMIDIYKRSDAPEDQRVAERLLQIRENMAIEPMEPIYEDANIITLKRKAYLSSDEADFESAYDDLLNNICFDKSSRYGSIPQALRDVHEASLPSYYGASYFRRNFSEMYPAMQGLTGNSVTPDQFKDAKTQLYWNMFACNRDMLIAFLKNDEAANLSLRMVQDAETTNASIEKHLSKKPKDPSAPFPK